MHGEQRSSHESNELYRAQLDAILGTPLTPDNIQTYADDALLRLIGLVQTATENYRTQFPDTFTTTREMEDAAFHHYGLQNIEAMLDHVADTANSIHDLDAVIQQADTVDYVITPPKPATPDLSPGSGVFQERPVQPRLKTTLFVLQEDFSVDARDPTQLMLITGAVPDQMMRKASYYQVIAPKLERMLLVCDEYGNMTYVFDIKAMTERGITNEQIAHMTKEDLNNLLDEHSQLGQRIIYHPQSFVV